MIGVEEEFPSSRGRTQLATKSSEIIDDRSTLLLPLSKKDKQKERKKKKETRKTKTCPTNYRILSRLTEFFHGIFPSREERNVKCLIREIFNEYIYIWNNEISLSRVGITLEIRFITR